MSRPLLPTLVLDNCYTSEQLDILGQTSKEFGKKVVFTHEWEGPKFGEVVSIRHQIDFRGHPEILNLVLSGIPKEIADAVVVQRFLHLQSFQPYEIHCDCGWLELAEDEVPYYLFIIPLETVPAATLVLNQTSDGLHFVDYKKDNLPLPESEQISEDVYQQYFSHCWPQERPYVSINTVFPWKRGSLLAFDMRRFHASDNFIAHGLTEKNGIVLMSKTKNTTA